MKRSGVARVADFRPGRGGTTARVSPQELKSVLTHLAIGLLGAGMFLRIVGKEKNRRHRHLLLRLIEQEKALAEMEAARAQQAAEAAAERDTPVVVEPVGQAA
jgi:hypothetical protein